VKLYTRPVPRRRVWSTLPLRRPDERGSSLLEVLVAIAVLSILLLGVMAAMSSSATISKSTGQVARTRAALATVTDRISTMKYPGCANPADIAAKATAAGFVPEGFTLAVDKVEGEVPPGACVASTSVILLTVRISHPASKTTLTGQVALRDKAAKP